MLTTYVVWIKQVSVCEILGTLLGAQETAWESYLCCLPFVCCCVPYSAQRVSVLVERQTRISGRRQTPGCADR